MVDPSNYTVMMTNAAARRDNAEAGVKCYTLLFGRSEPCGEHDAPCPLSTVMKTGESTVVERTRVSEDGQTRIYQIICNPMFDDDGCINRIVLVHTDITELRRRVDVLKTARHDLRNRLKNRIQETEALKDRIRKQANQRDLSDQALRESALRFRKLFTGVPCGIMIVDGEGIVSEINPAMLGMLGIAKEDIPGKPTLSEHVFPDEPELCEKIVVSIGSNVPFSETAPLRANRPSPLTMNIRTVPLPLQPGKAPGALVIADDVSEAVAAAESDDVMERLQTVTDISGVLSHKMIEFLQIADSSIHMARSTLESGALTELGPLLEHTGDAVKGGSRTAKRIQELTRSTGTRQKLLDLADIVRETASLARPWCKNVHGKGDSRSYSLELDLTPDCLIEGSETALMEAVFNLIRNAVEAQPDGGSVVVKTAKENGEVLLRIEDNRHPPIDKPFAVTESFVRNGLPIVLTTGLRSALDTLRRFGARIEIYPDRTGRTCIEARLEKKDRLHEIRSAPARDVPEVQLRILLIDDEEELVRMLGRGLNRLGQTTMVALSGHEGVEIFEEVHVDAVVCDLAMEGMNGWEVSSAIRAISVERDIPKPPFILLTGWGGQLTEEDVLSYHDVDRIVEKPVEITRLLEIIAEETSKERS